MPVCRGKVRYPSLEEADQGAAGQEVALRAYSCPYGAHWHLTSEVPTTTPRKRPKGMSRAKWRKTL